MTILQGNSRSIAKKIGEICTGQADLQPISFKSDRLLGGILKTSTHEKAPPVRGFFMGLLTAYAGMSARIFCRARASIWRMRSADTPY